MEEKYSEIERYDRAVFEYLSTISDKIVYAPTQMAIRTITKKEKFSDKKPWNFISFYRNPTFEIDWSRMNNPGTVSGELVRLTELTASKREAQYLQNIPVNLRYSVDIWASKSVEVQDIAIDLITKIYMQEQVLEVPLLSGRKNSRFHILEAEWTDNSDLERETEIGRVYRHTINFMIDSRLTLSRTVNTTKLCCVPVNIYE